MANITKTFLFPVPTEWMGQDQDDDNVGIATYNGPDRICGFGITWMEKVTRHQDF